MYRCNNVTVHVYGTYNDNHQQMLTNICLFVHRAALPEATVVIFRMQQATLSPLWYALYKKVNIDICKQSLYNT